MIDETSKKSLNAAIWYIITNFISKVILYICTPLYTRILTTSEYGEYSNFLSWQNILVTLLTFDLSAAIGMAYYDYEDKKRFDGFVNTTVVLSYLIPGLFCTIIFLFRDFFSGIFTIRKEYLTILLVFITFNNTLNIFQAEQRVRLEYKLSAILTLIASVLTIAITLLFVFTFRDRLKGVLMGGVIVNVTVSFILAIVIWRRCHDIKWEYAKYAFVLAVPLVPHVLAGTILGSSDKVMITKYCGDEYTALYNLAYTISMFITMISASINKAWTPWFYDRLKYNKREYIKIVSNIIVAVIAMGSVLICVLAPEILLVIGGMPYVAAAPIMPPIILACLINCVSTFYINIEFYNKKTAGISIATVISASLNVMLNYCFLGRFGYMAAAYTTLASSVITLLFHLYKVKKQGMIEVFDNKFLLTLIGVVCVVSETLIVIYNNVFIRCGVLFAFITLAGVMLYKCKSQIIMAVKSLKGENAKTK